MKNSMFKVIASLACAAVLAACGGGNNTTTTTPVPPQPVFTQTEGAAGAGTDVAAAGDLVTVHLTGFLYDETKADKKGTQFENSRTGSPYAFILGVGNRIAGQEQGILGMKVGGKRTLLIPSNMAFGPLEIKNAAGTVLVPANTAVVYDVEMIAITKSQLPPPPVGPVFTRTDLTLGTGAEAVSGDNLSVHYTGWLYSETAAEHKGAQFETSRNGSPFKFKLGTGAVIKGWDEGIVGMKVGGKRLLLIPADKAYGATGQGSIGPNQALVFEVEVTAITK